MRRLFWYGREGRCRYCKAVRTGYVSKSGHTHIHTHTVMIEIFASIYVPKVLQNV